MREIDEFEEDPRFQGMSEADQARYRELAGEEARRLLAAADAFRGRVLDQVRQESLQRQYQDALKGVRNGDINGIFAVRERFLKMGMKA